MLFDKGSLTNITKAEHMTFYSSKMIFIFNNCQLKTLYSSAFSVHFLTLSSRL